MTETIIRPAVEADLAAVRACLAETWHATYDPIFGAEQVTAISSRWHAADALRAEMQRMNTPAAKSVFLVACGGTEIIGTASAREVEPTVVLVQRLYVLPRAQGQGHGRALMQSAISSFPGVQRVLLDVEPRNARAIAFYEAHGFRLTEIVDRDHAGSVEKAAVFEKIIEQN